LAASTYGARRVWTQAILLSFGENDTITWDEYRASSAKLIGMKFIATSFDAACILEGARLAQWQVDRFPLKQFIDVFSENPPQALIAHFLAFLKISHDELVLPAVKCQVVASFLNALWRNPAAHQFVLRLGSIIPTVFGLNVVVAAEFKNCYDNWRRSLTRPIF
jgi:hypothetical protein